MTRSRWMFVVACLLSGAKVAAEPAVFTVEDPEGRNVALFESRAPLETVYGTTSRVSGTVVVDPGDPSGCRATIDVQLDSLDTGIDLRNHQMRTQYLETDRFPVVRFELLRLDDPVTELLHPGETHRLQGTGRFTLHGVSREEPFRAEVTYLTESEATRAKMPGNLLRLVAEADLLLGDYDIPVPQLVALKLDETIKVRIDVTATDHPGAASAPDEDEEE